MTQKEYNGWHNYETWNVKLWIDNDGSQEYWNDAARESSDVTELSERLKSEFEEGKDTLLKAAGKWYVCSVWSDLLGAALSEVNWREIAEAFWTDNPHCRGDDTRRGADDFLSNAAKR